MEKVDGGSDKISDAPIAALRPASTALLSTLLNPLKIIPTDNGLPRDWRGLAELAGINSEVISFLQSKSDPIAELVQLWCKTKDSGCRCFADLTAYLAVIDRFDVVDDLTPFLVADAQNLKTTQRNDVAVGSLNPADDKNILTIEDSERIHKGLPLTRYDAFLLHSDSEEDSSFANETINTLENKYGLKLCVKERDLLPGVLFEHEIIVRLIEERCNRFLVIFSPDFLKSSANQFLVSYAQASALESRVRKIVPCVYKKCELPPSVRFSFCIDYNRSGKLWNFWDKLSQSLSVPRPKEHVPEESISLPAVTPDSLSDTLARTAKLEESLKWWDADKSRQEELQGHKDSTFCNTSYDSSAPDTISIRSEAPLLGRDLEKATGSGKGKKWYKKLTSPIKNKKQKDKSRMKEQAIAE